VTRALEIIGEAARQVPAEVQQQYPQLPWQEMIAMRNVVIHEYVALDLQRVVEALDRLDPVERFAEIVRSIEA